MKGIILASSMALMVILVGYMAITSSSYESISQLSGYRRPAKVTVRGKVADIKTFPEKDLLLFILQDDNGSETVYAFYGLKRFISQYGAPPSHSTVDQDVVLKGTFYPDRMGEVLGRLEIEEILQGCHKAYEAPPATGG